MLPVPVLKAKAGRVRMVPAIAVMPVLAPRVGVASVSASVSLIETVAPDEFKLTAPVKLLVAVVNVITPAPALTVAAPAKMVPVVWLMPTPVNVSNWPVAIISALMVNGDVVVTMDTAPEVLVTLPVMVSPTASLSLNPPAPLVNAPRLVMVLAPARVTDDEVFPARVPVLITPVWVTAPVRLSVVAPPKVPVPVAPVVMFPRDTVVAFLMVSAVAVLLVVVRAPVKLMAPPSLPSMVMVLLPASMVLPEARVTAPV